MHQAEGRAGGLNLGRYAELAGELRRLSERYPLDEVLVAYEMTALYWSGRQADALALYPQTRSRLLTQGIEPGPELAALHQGILSQELKRPGSSGYGRRVPPKQTTAVPAPAGAFVGRAEELRLLTSATQQSAQVFVITGMPGVGKTRLAIEAALRLTGRYPDGQLFLEFHAHQAGAAPLGTDEAMRSLLEMTRAGLPPSPQSGKELAALWQGELEASRMIVILDDVPDANVVAPLLPRAGTCAILVTARQRLAGMAGASELPLAELPEHDAIRLFTLTSGLAGADDPEAVTQVVRSLGCHPLAVTLTASRLREGGGPSTAAELMGDITESGVLPAMADAAAGQFLPALEASYKALNGDQQRFFRLLGVHHHDLHPRVGSGRRGGAVPGHGR